MRFLEHKGFLFFFALGVRILAGVWVGHFSEAPIWEPELIANNLLAGRGFLLGDHLGASYRAFALPAYPIFCAVVYFFTHHSQPAVLLLQCLISAAACLQVRAIGERIFPKTPAGPCGAWLTALHPGLLFYATLLHPLTLDLFSYLWALWATLAFFQRPAPRRAAHLGAAAGLALLSRGTILLFFLLAGVLFLRKAGRDRTLGKGIRVFAIAAAVATLVVLPWLVRNAVLFKRFPLFITSANQSLWAGNNPLSIGTLHTRDGRALVSQFPPHLEKALARADELGQSDLFGNEARAFIRHNPWAAARLYARKWAGFWWFSPSVGLHYPPGYTAAYRLCYLVAAAMAIAGLWSVRGRICSPPVGLLLLFPLSIALFQCLYYVEGRHRWTVEPLLLLLAAQGGLALRAGFTTSRGRAGRSGQPGKARGGGVAGGALRRRRATQRGEANPPSPSGCSGRPPSPASLLLGVSLWIRRRRRSLHPAAWRSQRGSREVVKPALKQRMTRTPCASS